MNLWTTLTKKYHCYDVDLDYPKSDFIIEIELNDKCVLPLHKLLDRTWIYCDKLRCDNNPWEYSYCCCTELSDAVVVGNIKSKITDNRWFMINELRLCLGIGNDIVCSVCVDDSEIIDDNGTIITSDNEIKKIFDEITKNYG
jgi:hypothetical protein